MIKKQLFNELDAISFYVNMRLLHNAKSFPSYTHFGLFHDEFFLSRISLVAHYKI